MIKYLSVGKMLKQGKKLFPFRFNLYLLASEINKLNDLWSSSPKLAYFSKCFTCAAFTSSFLPVVDSSYTE